MPTETDQSTERNLDISQCSLTLIVNAKAGRQDADARIEQIRARIAPLVRRFTLRPVRHGRDIAAAARTAAKESDIVAALGGDGTQSAVAGALAGSGATMAVLPGGTFNYFARELGTEDLDTALDALAAGKTALRDLGAVNGRVFINNASFGLYPQILKQREEIYSRWGRSRVLAYWSVLVTLADLRDPMHLTVTTNRQQRDFRTPLAFVARSAYQLETLGLDGADAVRAGHFALFIAKTRSRAGLLTAALRLAAGQSIRGADFDLVTTDTLTIETRAASKLVALDGEKERMASPFRLEVRRGALRVIVPE